MYTCILKKKKKKKKKKKNKVQYSLCSFLSRWSRVRARASQL